VTSKIVNRNWHISCIRHRRAVSSFGISVLSKGD